MVSGAHYDGIDSRVINSLAPIAGCLGSRETFFCSGQCSRVSVAKSVDRLTLNPVAIGSSSSAGSDDCNVQFFVGRLSASTSCHAGACSKTKADEGAT